MTGTAKMMFLVCYLNQLLVNVAVDSLARPGLGHLWAARKNRRRKRGAVNALDSNGNAVSTEAIGSQEASVTANITIQPRWQESCFK